MQNGMLSLQSEYAILREKIENLWSDQHLPQCVLQFYLLVDPIATRDLNSFINRYGAQTVDVNLAAEGKEDYLGLGLLNEFEIEAIYALENEITTRS